MEYIVLTFHVPILTLFLGLKSFLVSSFFGPLQDVIFLSKLECFSGPWSEFCWVVLEAFSSTLPDLVTVSGAIHFSVAGCKPGAQPQSSGWVFLLGFAPLAFGVSTPDHKAVGFWFICSSNHWKCSNSSHLLV